MEVFEKIWNYFSFTSALCPWSYLYIWNFIPSSSILWKVRKTRGYKGGGVMHRICGWWLGSKIGVCPAVSPFVVFTKKYLQLYCWSSTTFTASAKWTNHIESSGDALISNFVMCLCSDLTRSYKECFLK